MSDIIELDELALCWFTTGDLEFYEDADLGCQACVHTISSIDGTKSAPPFLILKRGLDYEIGQLYDYKHDESKDDYECDELRHPSIIKQNFQLPHSVPVHKNFLGPFPGVGVHWVMRVVQATLSNDAEMRDDAKNALQTYFGETRTPRRPQLQVLSFG